MNWYFYHDYFIPLFFKYPSIEQFYKLFKNFLTTYWDHFLSFYCKFSSVKIRLFGVLKRASRDSEDCKESKIIFFIVLTFKT